MPMANMCYDYFMATAYTHTHTRYAYAFYSFMEHTHTHTGAGICDKFVCIVRELMGRTAEADVLRYVIVIKSQGACAHTIIGVHACAPRSFWVTHFGRRDGTGDGRARPQPCATI